MHNLEDPELSINDLSYKSGREKDALAWDSLIAGYLKCGKLDEAFNVYHSMHKVHSLLPSSHILIALLKACAKLKDLKRGGEVHVGAAETGLLEIDCFIGSTLVDMYAKCRSLAKAQQAFEKLQLRSTVSWNTMMAACVKHGQGEKALYCFMQMQSEGMPPDAVTFVCCLKACACIGSMDKVQEIHADIWRNGYLGDLVVANTLIDVYAKGGLLMTAWQVFDNLPIRDAISWNALITGYTEHGHGNTALQCYERMLADGVSPTNVTYICVLKACSITKAMDKGQEVHNEVIRKKLIEDDLMFGNTLVDVYGKGGCLPKAQEVFNKLPYRDVFSWNALIGGYSEYGCGEKALECFQQMRQEKVVPDAVTFVCTLKACIKTKSTNNAMGIHAEVERKGFLCTNRILGNTLVDFYAKCGLLVKAQEVFERLPFRDVVACNTMIAGYSDHGFGKCALECFDEMQQLEGVHPDSLTFACTLRACGREGAIGKALKIHAEMERKGLVEIDLLVGNALINVYCECGILSIAQEVFDRLRIHDAISWNTLVAGYANHEHGHDALVCFEEMHSQGVSMDSVTYVCGLKACGITGDGDTGSQIHAEVERKGLVMTNHIIASTLVDMYAKCGAVAKGQEVFDKLPVRDPVSWNVLLAGYAEHGSAEEALRCYDQMQSAGIPLNTAAALCSMKAYAKVGATWRSHGLHNEIQKSKALERNYIVGSTLVDMFVKCGLLVQAQEVFDQLSVQDAVPWNALMAGYGSQGQEEEALLCLNQMQLEGVSPDAVTYMSSLRVCSNLGAIDKGRELHVEMIMKGLLDSECAVGNTLVDVYAKCGLLAEARDVFNRLFVQDVVSWNVLLGGYAQAGQSEDLIYAFGNMLGWPIKPDEITFVIVLNACTRACLFDPSHTYFETMTKDYGIAPSLEHHACMIDLLGRMGHLDKAALMIRKMPIEPNRVVWHMMLAASKEGGNVTLGKHAFKHAMGLDDKVAACLQVSELSRC